MMAKMENIGPFHWFFTLSCGDMKWCANFSSYFEEKSYGLSVTEEGNVQMSKEWKEGEDLTEGWTGRQGDRTMKRQWDEFKESEEFKKSVHGHDKIRNDVLLATRNFQHRVEMFRREVIFGSNNPMKVRHITYRV